jgi:hypothetical protein
MIMLSKTEAGSALKTSRLFEGLIDCQLAPQAK